SLDVTTDQADLQDCLMQHYCFPDIVGFLAGTSATAVGTVAFVGSVAAAFP
ncbi:hypothetical protein A2U01_0105235, partial [Trifolium medium]|nr:hypothetical protein [Trifolium medium]